MTHNSTSRIMHRVSRIAFHVFRFVLLFLAGLAATRLLYEGFFPQLIWLGRPFPAFFFALIVAWLTCPLAHSSACLPLLLNLLYLFEPAVDLVGSRLIFGASVWLTAVLASYRWQAASEKGQVKNVILLLAALIPVYFLTMPATVGRADTFEFQVVAPQLGIAHPTGYPLYLLLGKLFTLVPIGSVAWRLNAGTAVFALIALILLSQLGRHLFGQPIPALLGALALGLVPAFWSQAIEAEVYTLHALIITTALLLIQAASGKWQVTNSNSQFTIHYSIFFLIGLGLTNHLTAVFLLPPAILTLLFAHRFRLKSLISNPQSLFKLALAFLLPLALYAYLPIRWAAVNGEAMGFGRFIDWVVGGRFQDALQWDAWLRDPARYEIVGRLFLDNWGWLNLAVAAIGLIYLFVKRWRMALILLVTWLGFTFYNLNYYVPDLSVFLIPAQIVIAIWWMGGVTAVLKIKDLRLKIKSWNANANLQSLIISFLIIPTLLAAVANWLHIDRSGDDGLAEWGSGVLALPLAENAAILADSEKIAPLYYLQQAEGVRPDLDIMVLPDEAAYRAELNGRIAAGQTVYLARFLPGLEGVYHLRSMGPLTEVSAQPLTELPGTAVPLTLDFDSIQLLGYELEPKAAIDRGSTAVTLYWQLTANSQQSAANNKQIYMRWKNQESVAGQLPANNYYPIPAWEAGEIVPDFHLLPHPISDQEMHLSVQAALAPPFAAPDTLDWQTVTTLTLPPTEQTNLERPYRAQIGSTLLSSAQFPTQIRPQQPLPITVSGYGTADDLAFHLDDVSGIGIPDTKTSDGNSNSRHTQTSFSLATEINVREANGRYQLIVRQPNATALCGWLQSSTDSCILGEVEISGVPLPDGAINYDDKIALLAIDLPETQLQPGGLLPVNLAWQSLAPIAEDYTVFIQILGANDRIVGQVDAWPLQGTHPTGQWEPGETIADPYLIQLDDSLPPGQYRLIIGWYRLADLRRLPILNEDGAPVDDKLVVPRLVVP
ncbi:MAG: DUF2723 domain-containing protein [Chloroflexi bacterium]|nr:DUF2723 domain-containing protein [Chloroflexota bacterium]